MQKKKLFILITFVLVLASLLVFFNLEKDNNKNLGDNEIENNVFTDNDMGIFNPVSVTKTINKNKIELCSNKYYETEYHVLQSFYPGWDNDGRIVVKDFPYYDAAAPKSDTAVICDRVTDIKQEYQSGCCGSSKSWVRCFRERPSLDKISDLACVQKIKLGGIIGARDGGYSVHNCFFEDDDLRYLSELINLEKITFDGCGNINIDNEWWENLKNLKEIEINSPESSPAIFDNILPVIEKIPTIESVQLNYGTIGFYWYAGQRDNLCNWIDNWENIKNINDIKINNKGEFIVLSDKGEELVRYNDCQSWLSFYKKAYEDDSKGR